MTHPKCIALKFMISYFKLWEMFFFPPEKCVFSVHIVTRWTLYLCLWLLISISVSIGTKTEYQLKIKYIIILYIIIKRWNEIKQHWHTFVIVFYSFPSSSNPMKKERKEWIQYLWCKQFSLLITKHWYFVDCLTFR